MRVAVSLLFVLCALLSFATANPQANVWQPSPGHTQIPIWPKEPPNAEAVAGPEVLEPPDDFRVAGKPVAAVTNVTRPTMTIYSPKTKNNTGVAVVVLPGGGFEDLAIDLEGTEVCDWLTSKGITCVLLKYRVPSLPYDWRCKCRPDGYVTPTLALEDVQRTMGLVRSHAAEWHINPHKIGVIGFSAGGYLVAEISTKFDHRLYPLVDEVDKLSCRPDFAVAIFPGHLGKGANLELNPNVPVTPQTPTTFLLQAEDDHVDSVNDSLAYYVALKNAAVPVEMHLYAEGGHAFGMRRTKFPITGWPQLVETWLKTIGMIESLTNR
jgi:acetyl esterase/lipase